jgi:hypothetical protein
VSKLKDRLQKDAQRNGFDLTISIINQLPGMVKGEPDGLRQLIVYFTSDAFKRSPTVKVDINLIGTKDDKSLIGLSFQDDSPNMSEEQLDVCFPFCYEQISYKISRTPSRNLNEHKPKRIGHPLPKSRTRVHLTKTEIRLTSQPSRATWETSMDEST